MWYGPWLSSKVDHDIAVAVCPDTVEPQGSCQAAPSLDIELRTPQERALGPFRDSKRLAWKELATRDRTSDQHEQDEYIRGVHRMLSRRESGQRTVILVAAVRHRLGRVAEGGK